MQRRYDRLIIIQRKTVTQSPSGGETETWVDLCYRVTAHMMPTRGNERMTTAQQVAEQEVTFTVRFHAIAAASRPLHPEDRILYPVDGLAANVQSPASYLIHDILSSDEVGRMIDLSIKTKRRADVLT